MNYEECLYFLITKVRQKINGILKSKLQHIGLTPAQSAIILLLCNEEGMSAGEISSRLTIDNATISGILDRMEKDDWIIKKIAPDDGRMFLIFLSSKAFAVKDKLWSAIEESNQEIMKPLKLEERILLERFLRDLKK